MQHKWHPEELEEQVQTEPYSALAEIYDHVMEHVDYRAWTDYLLVLCQRHNHIPSKILELACGTGSLLMELGKNGFIPYGSDRSLVMLKIAKQKLNNTGQPFGLFQADIINIPVKAEFDTILCMYDSMNYLSSLEQIIQTVQNVMMRLIPGGVFIFDMCTEYNSLTHFNSVSSSQCCGDYIYTRNSYYRKEERIQITDFIITDRKTGRVRKERHRQYVYPFSEVHTVLSRTIPGRIRMFKDYTFDSPAEQCERVHFYIEKAEL